MGAAASICYIVSTTSFFTFLWYGLYKGLCRSLDYMSTESVTRIIAALHAIVCIVLSLICLKEGANPLSSPGEPNSSLQLMTMHISVGYFIYDFIWCLRYQPESKLILFHHFASIFSMCYIIVLGESGAEAIGGLGSMEVTNPLLQTRWFLREFNMKNTTLFCVVEYLFFATFLSVRLGYGSMLLYAVLMSEKTNFIVKMITVSLYVISLIFIYQIVTIVLRRILRNVASRRQMNVQRAGFSD